MQGRPPKKKPLDPARLRAAEAFVAGAEALPEANVPSEAHVRPGATPASPSQGRERERGGEGVERPWEAPHVREDVVKGYALRLPEPLYLQLKWVAEETGRSINTVCREAIEREIASYLPIGRG